MGSMPTMRTGERVTTTHTTQATTGTVLARIARVNPSNKHPIFLSLIDSCLSDSAMLPERQSTAQGSSSYFAFLGLRHIQVFKDKYSICGCPLNKLFCRLLSKGASA